MSKIDTFRRGLRWALGITLVMALIMTGAVWLMIGHTTQELTVMTAVLVVLSGLFALWIRSSSQHIPSWKELPHHSTSDEKVYVLMWHKGRPFDFVHNDPTAPDPV